MKKLFYLIPVMIFSILLSGCAMNDGTTENSSPPSINANRYSVLK